MASLDDQPTFSSPTPHFFKVIHDRTSRDRGVQIPVKFVMEYGRELSSSVNLKLPSGAEWEIQVTKRDGGVWFEKGWPEFSKFYSLECCDWLVFQYVGKSKFRVLIFDRSCTEIDYPIAMPEGEETDDSEEDDEESVQNLDDFPPCQKKRRGKSPLPCSKPDKEIRASSSSESEEEDESDSEDDEEEDDSEYEDDEEEDESDSEADEEEDDSEYEDDEDESHPHKKMRTTSSSKAECNSKLRPSKSQSCETEKSLSKSEMKREDESEDHSVAPSKIKNGVGRMHISKKRGKAIALERATAFETVKPSFRVIMQPSHTIQSYVSLPIEFVRRHHITEYTGNVILRGPSGGTWSVKFKCENSKAQFQYGWLAFARHYHLEVDDVCVFILNKGIKLSFEVVLFRCKEATICPLPHAAREVATRQVDPNEYAPKSSVKVSPRVSGHRGNSTVHALASSSKNSLKQKNKSVKFQGRDKSGLCDMIFEKSMENKASHWSKPEIETEDDFPTKKDVGGSPHSWTSPKGTPVALGRMEPLTKAERTLALQRMSSFKTEDPYFPVVIQPAYIHSNYLAVPIDFVRRHICQPAAKITLKTANGRTWPVEFNTRRLQLGWLNFARDNSLKVGDVCAFVLIRRAKLVFEVVFFRTAEAENCTLSPGHSKGATDHVKVEPGCSLDFSPEIGKHKNIYTSSFRALEAANKLIPKNPFFRGIVRPGSRQMYVPAKFAKRFLDGKKQTGTLEVGEKAWPVSLLSYRYKPKAKISGGWPAFVDDNCLREGDVCTFELTEKSGLVLKVHIFRS